MQFYKNTKQSHTYNSEDFGAKLTFFYTSTVSVWEVNLRVIVWVQILSVYDEVPFTRECKRQNLGEKVYQKNYPLSHYNP